ncbi:MAG: bifunctional molybdenum cofactor biosynthesis protein MoaC/MoaB [Sphingobacteriaceae bacterium]|nr:bifunctional molybdenum cofactor biosynthesis protein MoaC/MoaB [Sphingobacteriaceae bacterium]
MVDILSKINTQRSAIAQAIVLVSSQKTIDAIVNKQVPKGDVFEMSKTAGLFAVKKTSDVIPDCHPLPIEFTTIKHTVNGLQISILVEVHTIYKTGVEVEAMYGASVVAMTMYDMLKPIDKGITIEKIALIEKSGGKTDFRNDSGKGLNSAIIIVSDSIANGKKEDKGGQIILKAIQKHELNNIAYDIIPDDQILLASKIKEYVNKTDLIIVSGGTGFTKKDKTPETLKELMDSEIPGIMEWARSYGQNRTPYAMFSRGLSGIINQTMILAIPGSTNGAKETIDALFPYVLHGFKMLKHKK